MNHAWTLNDVRRLRELADWLETSLKADPESAEDEDKIFAWPDSAESSASNDAAFLAAAREEYANRDARFQVLPREILAEPAWDMLLDLYINGALNRRVSVTSACIASRVPPTTALRWLCVLERLDLVEREPDPTDSRRSWVVLTALARQKMEHLMRRRISGRQPDISEPGRIVSMIRPSA
jgi:DNA-binding MarR family transcriptional regulator